MSDSVGFRRESSTIKKRSRSFDLVLVNIEPFHRVEPLEDALGRPINIKSDLQEQEKKYGRDGDAEYR